MIQGVGAKRKADYLGMTRYCIASLLIQGIDPGSVTCIAENKKHCKRLGTEFGINVIHGPSIPKNYGHLVKKSGGRKLVFYKPLSLSECMPNPIDEDTTMVMSDVDSLFTSDPSGLSMPTDVWSQHAFRYLRPSRTAKLSKAHRSPRLDSMKDLTGYFGCKTQAYLFIKHGQTVLPEYRLTSNLVFMRPSIYSDLIKIYREMSDDVIINHPKYCKGDQVILSSAMNVLGLSYSRLPEECSKQYNGGLKQNMLRDAKKMGVRLVNGADD